MKTRLAVCLLAGLAIEFAAPACAQSYPAKSIRIVTSPAGGGNDFPARLIARALAGPLGQQIVVDNRATVLIADIVRQAPPDGYTLLVTGSAHWIGPLISKVTYDPVRDFAPITLIDRAPSVLVVHPSMPLKSVKQLIALAKARPGEMNFSVGGPGSSGYLGALLFNHMAGVNIVSIPYKGTAPALVAVMSGETQAMFGSAGSVAPHVAVGRLRALAVGSVQPSRLAPGLPTVAQEGLSGFQSEALHALFAPAGTPPAAIALLNREVGNYLRSPKAQAIFLKAGIEPSPGTPEELSAIMKSEVERIGAVLKATGTGAR
ncbi:MAG TPA: tripartite tricarboxylate transporter substrate-binding protein [Candidatus Binatia bacterium]|nr:tripartite tricarboxylate transporter substrate-binding protein [Candidatus Binatia bacterium]